MDVFKYILSPNFRFCIPYQLDLEIVIPRNIWSNVKSVALNNHVSYFNRLRPNICLDFKYYSVTKIQL